MRNSLMSIADKILLRKRALIETVNDELKNIAQINTPNIILSAISLLIHCQLSQHIVFFEKKPAIAVKFINNK